MSKLREQLNRERENYLAAKYPGDLIADVLVDAPHRRSIGGWIWGGIGLVAAAAAIALALYVQVPRSPAPTVATNVPNVNDRTNPVTQKTTTTESPFAVTPASIPTMNVAITSHSSTSVNYVSEAPTFSVAPPTMSFDSNVADNEDGNTSNATTREAA